MNIYPPMRSSERHVAAARSVYTFSLSITLVIAALIILAGIALVLAGAKGATEFSLFGNSFKSGTVGAVAIFCGAVMAVLNVRRVLGSVENMAALPPDESAVEKKASGKTKLAGPAARH